MIIIHPQANPLLNILELNVFVANLVAHCNAAAIDLGADTPSRAIGAKDGSTNTKRAIPTPRPIRNSYVSCKRCSRHSTV